MAVDAEFLQEDVPGHDRQLLDLPPEDTFPGIQIDRDQVRPIERVDRGEPDVLFERAAVGEEEEVRGDGVVGEQPRIMPGHHFQYTSGCVLTTPIGTMHGTYRFWRDDGTYFDATIAPFSLASPVRGEEAN